MLIYNNDQQRHFRRKTELIGVRYSFIKLTSKLFYHIWWHAYNFPLHITPKDAFYSIHLIHSNIAAINTESNFTAFHFGTKLYERVWKTFYCLNMSLSLPASCVFLWQWTKTYDNVCTVKGKVLHKLHTLKITYWN